LLECETQIFTQYYEQTAPVPDGAMWTAIQARIRQQTDEISSAIAPQGAAHQLLLPQFRLWLESVLASPVFRQAAFAAVLVSISVAATALYFSLNSGNVRNADGVAINQDVSTTPSPVPAPEKQVTENPKAAIPQSEKPPKQPQPVELVQNRKPAAGATIRDRKIENASGRILANAHHEDALIQAQIMRAASEYQRAVRLLERKIHWRRGQLDAALIAQYEKSLKLIDHSIAESRRALRQHPGDAAAGQFLLTAYARKVELMQEIALQ
jgi:hypothetical protein